MSNNEYNEENNFQSGVIYTNNITEVDDDTYKLYQESKSNNYDINKLNINIKSEMELSSFSKSNDSTEDKIINEEKLDDDNDNDKLNIPIIEKEQEIQKNNVENENNLLLYGNDINNLYPKYLGKMLSLIYIKNQPLITIGPDCKFFII
jgi:hypothetical protein